MANSAAPRIDSRKINRISLLVFVVGSAMLTARWYWGKVALESAIQANQAQTAHDTELLRLAQSGTASACRHYLQAHPPRTSNDLNMVLIMAQRLESEAQQTPRTPTSASERVDRDAAIRIVLEAVLARPTEKSIDSDAYRIATSAGMIAVAQDLKRRGSVDMRDALFQAAHSGQVQLVDQMLREGVDPNTHSQRDYTALCAAASGRAPGNTEVVRMLLARGADVKAGGSAALMTAARFGNAGTVRELLAHGADANFIVQPRQAAGPDPASISYLYSVRGSPTIKGLIMAPALRSGTPGARQVTETIPGGDCPLAEAALNGNTEIVRLLVDHGARPNLCAKDGRTALHYVASQPFFVPTASPFQRNGVSNTPAIGPDAVSLLVKVGAHPNVKDAEKRTPLHCAAASGDRSLPYVRALLNAGADADAQDARGETPLMAAVKSANASSRLVAALLTKKAAVDREDGEKRTALCMAVLAGKAEDTRLLIQHKADVNHRDMGGQTPLITACRSRFSRAEEVKILIAAGADATMKDAAGLTALDTARKNHHAVMIPILENAQARR